MCGIAGAIQLTGAIEDLQIQRVQSMLNRIIHRGPDERGFHSYKDHAVGSVRLKIVGDDYGHQPVMSGQYCLAYNGEIYNHTELSQKHNLSSLVDSDTEVLFRLLVSNGMELLDSLNGMFSFCFTTPEQIFLVRDRIGQKPLYYRGCPHYTMNIF